MTTTVDHLVHEATRSAVAVEGQDESEFATVLVDTYLRVHGIERTRS